MNIILAVDEKVAAQARKAARAMGKSLDQIVQGFLEQLAGRSAVEAEIEEFRALAGRGTSGGERFNRDELYAQS